MSGLRFSAVRNSLISHMVQAALLDAWHELRVIGISEARSMSENRGSRWCLRALEHLRLRKLGYVFTDRFLNLRADLRVCRGEDGA